MFWWLCFSQLVAKILANVTPRIPVQNTENTDYNPLFIVDEVDMFLETILKDTANVSLPQIVK